MSYFAKLLSIRPSRALASLKEKQPVWAVLVATSTVAIVCTAAIYQLNQMAERSNETRLLLTQAKEQMSRLNSLEWESISKGEIDDNLVEELAENQEATEYILGKLEAIDRRDNNDSLDRFFVAYSAYRDQVKEALELVSQGKIKEVLEINAHAIDEVYDDLYSKITRLEDRYVYRNQSTRALADFGTATALILSAITIGILFHQFSQKLRHKKDELEVAFGDLQQAQGQLIQQEKMAALGQLITGVSHEINNPLGAIKASASNTEKALQEALLELPLLHQYLSPEERESFFALITQATNGQPLVDCQGSRDRKRKLVIQLQGYDLDDDRYIADLLTDMGISENLDFLSPLLTSIHHEWAVQLAYNLTCSFVNNQIILHAVDQSSKIVFALKNYARSDASGNRQLVNVNNGLETVLKIYHSQLKNNIHIIRDYQTIPDILGYPDELIQVWTNLIHNAIHAMAGNGTLTISTRHQDHTIEVSIADTGAGIPADIQHKIFDAFFTTKPAGEGSGLGLYISQKILEKHNGRMAIESQPGRTRFSVFLPA